MVQSTSDRSTMLPSGRTHYFFFPYRWQISQCLFIASFASPHLLLLMKIHWIMIARASGKKGTKTLSLNIHNLIYSIIIYYSTPLGLDRSRRWERNMASCGGRRLFLHSMKRWHVIMRSDWWFIITFFRDWNVLNIVMEKRPTDAHYSIVFVTKSQFSFAIYYSNSRNENN